MQPRRSLWPGVLLGVGLGAFVDGILMHQVLQWHHMLSSEGCCPPSTLSGLEENTLADGIFHAVAWLLTLAGALALIKAWRGGRPSPPGRAQAGALLGGWGIFNLLDSANHFLLDLHHVREDLGGPVGWDVGFLVFALALIALGARLAAARPKRGPGATGAPTRPGSA